LLNSGRGRGRPKKNAGRVTMINPCTQDYFKTLDKVGGPTDPLYSFDESVLYLYEGNEDYQENPCNHPFYEFLSKYTFTATPGFPLIFVKGP
jgi:hypothetical protein